MQMKLIMEGWRSFERVEDLLQERSILKEAYPFKAVYIVGPSGAGKTTVKNFIGLPQDFISSNTDDRVENVFPSFDIPQIYEPPPEAGGQEDLWIVQQNTRIILQNAEMGHTTNLVMKGAPMLFDTTGHKVGKILGRAGSLVDMGYDVAIFQINVPTSVSVDRDRARGDSGGRSVGEKGVEEIGDAYQNNVVRDKGYFRGAAKLNKISGGDNITILGGAVFPNIYALANFAQFKKGDLTVSREAAAALGNPTFAETQAILEQAKTDLVSFLGPVRNPKGQAVLAGMKKLIALTDGKQGQNMAHLFATQGTEFAEDPVIATALQAMGASAPKTKAKGAIRKEKQPAMPTVRGLTRTLGKKYGMRGSPKE